MLDTLSFCTVLNILGFEKIGTYCFNLIYFNLLS